MAQYTERRIVVEAWQVGSKPVPTWVRQEQDKGNFVLKKNKKEAVDYIVIETQDQIILAKNGDYLEYVNFENVNELPIYKVHNKEIFEKKYQK